MAARYPVSQINRYGTGIRQQKMGSLVLYKHLENVKEEKIGVNFFLFQTLLNWPYLPLFSGTGTY